MKILIPVLGFAPAGGYRVLSYLSDLWTEMGHEVHFLSPQGEDMPFFPTRAPVLATSMSGVIERPCAKIEGIRLRGAKKMLALQRGLTAIGKNYDVVLANHSLTPYCFLLTGIPQRSRFYYIQAYEPDYFATERQPVKWALAKLSYFLRFNQIANTAIYASHSGVDPQAIVPAGIDLRIFHAKEHAASMPPHDSSGEIVIGCIGRKEPVKGTKYVLSAFEMLAQKSARYRLRVAYGNLPEGWSHPRAEVVVPQSDLELAAFYRSLDILVAAGTVQHGAPHYPVMEAMASGTAVVTTGYLPASTDNSWLVRNEDASDITRAIIEISQDTERKRKISRGLVDIQDYSWPIVSNKMIVHFEHVLRQA